MSFCLGMVDFFWMVIITCGCPEEVLYNMNHFNSLIFIIKSHGVLMLSVLIQKDAGA